MSLYTLALFLHVSGAIGAFVSLGIWLFGLAALRRTRRVEQVRAIAWLVIVASPLMVVSVLLLGLAGFAMALGLPVIFTCREDHMKDVHFDTNHFPHVVWSQPADLRTKLNDRIVGAVLPTVGRSTAA